MKLLVIYHNNISKHFVSVFPYLRIKGTPLFPNRLEKSHPTPDPVAPVYGPVLGTTATPEAVGGLGRRVWLLRMARAQRAREAPPLGRGRGVIFELRYELLYCKDLTQGDLSTISP